MKLPYFGSSINQPPWLRKVEALLLGVLALLVSSMVFLELFGESQARGFWIFPLLIWAAVRFGIGGTVVMLVVTLLFSLAGALLEKGFFAHDLAETHLLNWGLYNGSLAILSFGLAASRGRQALLAQALESGHNEMLLCEARQLRICEASAAALRNLGYGTSELMRKQPMDLCPELTEREFRELIRPLQEKTEQKICTHTKIQRKNGSQYPAEVNLQLFEREGKTYVLAMLLDQTEAEETESQLRALLNMVQAVIWITDGQGNLQLVTNYVKKVLGTEAAAMQGSNITDTITRGLIHPDDRAAHELAYKKLLEEGTSITSLIHRARHADGSWRWMSVSASPVFDAKGKITQIIGVVNDVHVQQVAAELMLQNAQELEQRVRQAVQESQQKDALIEQQSHMVKMGEMLGNIAHQWRQPLNTLSLILADMLDASKYGEADDDYLKMSVANANAILQKMSGTIEDFADYYRRDRELEPISLSREIGATISLVSAALRFNDIKVEVVCPQEVEVWAYGGDLSQAFMNLINNAKDAIVENKVRAGRITIVIEKENKVAKVTVTDNGGGIAPSVLPRIFEPYFTTKERGIGIGLYICKNAIEKMNGTIAVSNVEEGAQFTVSLPLRVQGQGAHHEHD